ncbi:hypothetical protein ACFS07_02300 [Undibacterium arcticum]
MTQEKVKYVMYDTYFGATEGLKTFKTMLGFKPYRVFFSITDERADSRPTGNPCVPIPERDIEHSEAHPGGR